MKQRLQAWGDSKVLFIVGCFVFNEDNELLLLRRHPENLGGSRWGTVGGRIEPGESEKTAMQREFQEETGITRATFSLLGSHEIHMPHGTVHMTSYKIIIPRATPIILEPEAHTDYAWFSQAALLGADDLLWGIPSILHDFSLLDNFTVDQTLTDGSSVIMLSSKIEIR
jgi:mutator protein MutT